MVTGSPVNVKDYGAKGDGITDDSDAIQDAFNTLHIADATNASDFVTARPLAKHIYFPAGKYRVTKALTIGVVDKVIMYNTFDMNGASIVSEYAGASAALTIYFPSQCSFKGLAVYAGSATAINLQNSNGCSYTDITAGSNSFASIHVEGMQFDNTWRSINLAGNAQNYSGTYAWYWDCTTSVSPFGFGGGPINSFTGMYVSGAKNLMYWKGGSDINITVIELESAAGPLLKEGASTFENCTRVSLSEVYQEDFPNPCSSIYFKNCTGVYLRNIMSGSYYHTIGFETCKGIKIDNYLGGGGIKYVGTVSEISIDNMRVFANEVRSSLVGGAAGSIKSIQVKNLFVRDALDTADVARVPLISTGNLNTADNWLKNPRALDASGNVANTWCTCVNNAGYQTVSPLGFIESVFEITFAGSYPYSTIDFDTAKLNGAKTSKAVLVVAWKNTVPVGFTAVGSSGPDGPGIYTNDYGDILFTSGDWLLTYTLVNLDSAATNVSIVWNYASSFAIGTKFLFGGAILYAGSEIKYPLIA
jgi:hypothetical protein